MRRRARTSLGLALASLVAGTTLVACHYRETLRFTEEPDRAWDLAWLIPVDFLGRAVQEPQRFTDGGAGVDLVEEAAGYVVVGLALDDLPPRLRQRVDLGRLNEAELGRASAEYLPIEPQAKVSSDHDWLELAFANPEPYLDVIGPRSLEPGLSITSTVALDRVVRLATSPRFCGPVHVENRSPTWAEDFDFAGRSYAELYPLTDDTLVTAFHARPSTVARDRAALVRLRPLDRVTRDDVHFLDGPALAGVSSRGLRHLSVQHLASPSTELRALVSHLAAKVEGGTTFYRSHLSITDLPPTAAWTNLETQIVPLMGPELHGHRAPTFSAAETHQGDLVAVGGRNNIVDGQLVPTGFLAISPAISGTSGFQLHDVTFSGKTNGDILYRTTALPPDPARSGQSIFAVGGRRGEIAIMAYDPRLQTLEELDRWVPPADFTVMTAVGYQDMFVVSHPNGYELWAVGEQSLLLRRTVDGRWQMITNVLRDHGLVEQRGRACTPLGFPRGSPIMRAARRGQTALVALANCHGALLIRFDEDDEPLCATVVLPPDKEELEVDDVNNFDALTAVEDGYYMITKSRLELFHVAVEDE